MAGMIRTNRTRNRSYRTRHKKGTPKKAVTTCSRASTKVEKENLKKIKERGQVTTTNEKKREILEEGSYDGVPV